MRMRTGIRIRTQDVLFFALAGVLLLGGAGAYARFTNDPMNWDCSRVILNPDHDGRAAADRVNAFLNDGGGDSFFFVLNHCQAAPGESVAQAAQDIQDEANSRRQESAAAGVPIDGNLGDGIASHDHGR